MPATLSFLKTILQDRYGIADPSITQLHGEFDLNYRAETPGSALLLKLMRPECSADLVAMQVAALTRAQRAGLQVETPSVVLNLDGATFDLVDEDRAAAHPHRAR